MTTAGGASSSPKTGKSPKTKKPTKAQARAKHMAAQKQERQRIAAETAKDVANVTKPGRPSKYSLDVVKRICAGIAAGQSMRTVLREDDSLPAMSTIFEWLADRNEDGTPKYPDFSEQYERAQQMRTEAFAEDVLDIADNSTNDYMDLEDEDGRQYSTYNPENVARAKLRIDTRLHLMSKHKPKKYGNQLDPGAGAPPLVALIYLPKEMPYNATKPKDQETVIDGEVVEHP